MDPCYITSMTMRIIIGNNYTNVIVHVLWPVVGVLPLLWFVNFLEAFSLHITHLLHVLVYFILLLTTDNLLFFPI